MSKITKKNQIILSKVKLIFLLSITLNSAFGQKVCNEFYYKKFKKQELISDIEFVREKIINAHINPFTEISKEEFEKNIIQIKNSLKDGMTQKDFYFATKSIFVKLNDEHAGLNDFCITDSIKNNLKYLPLRFKLINNKVILTENFSNENLIIEDELISINNFSINEIVNGCSEGVFGISEERKTIVVQKLWLYLSKFCYFITDDYTLKFKSGKSVLIKGQTIAEINSNYKKKNQSNILKPITDYQKIKNFGFLKVNTFDDSKLDVESWKHKIDSIFHKIKNDKVDKLIIDVSDNGGGNSAIGNIIINYISDKNYKTYSGKWKKSEEYSAMMEKENSVYEKYEKLNNGEIMPLISKEIKATKNENRFNGKTYLLVGESTFSSAMMFAVTVLDNNLATVIGQIPSYGHPNHFGELIFFKTPNTELNFCFSVKEWIRPSGNKENNKLIPEVVLDIKNKSREEIIQFINDIK